MTNETRRRLQIAAALVFAAVSVVRAGGIAMPVGASSFHNLPSAGFVGEVQAVLSRPGAGFSMGGGAQFASFLKMDANDLTVRRLMGPMAAAHAELSLPLNAQNLPVLMARAQELAVEGVPALVSEIVEQARVEGVNGDALQQRLAALSGVAVYGPEAAKALSRATDLAVREYRATTDAEGIARSLQSAAASPESENAALSVQERGARREFALRKAEPGAIPARSSWLKPIPAKAVSFFTAKDEEGAPLRKTVMKVSILGLGGAILAGAVWGGLLPITTAIIAGMGLAWATLSVGSFKAVAGFTYGLKATAVPLTVLGAAWRAGFLVHTAMPVAAAALLLAIPVGIFFAWGKIDKLADWLEETGYESTGFIYGLKGGLKFALKLTQLAAVVGFLAVAGAGIAWHSWVVGLAPVAAVLAAWLLSDFRSFWGVVKNLIGFLVGLIPVAVAVAPFAAAAMAVAALHASLPLAAAVVGVLPAMAAVAAWILLVDHSRRFDDHMVDAEYEGFMNGFLRTAQFALGLGKFLAAMSFPAMLIAGVAMGAAPMAAAAIAVPVGLWIFGAPGSFVNFVKSAVGFAVGLPFVPLALAPFAGVAVLAAALTGPLAFAYAPLLAAAAGASALAALAFAANHFLKFREFFDARRDADPDEPFLNAFFGTVNFARGLAGVLGGAALIGLGYLGLSGGIGAAFHIPPMLVAGGIALGAGAVVAGLAAIAQVMFPVLILMAVMNMGRR